MNILVASALHPDALEDLRQHHDVVCAFSAPEDELKDKIADREVLVFRSGVQITAAVMGCAPRLRLILRAGSGTDNIDLDYVKKRGIPFHRIAGPAATAVSEMAFCMMLALSRQLFRLDREWRRGHWVKGEVTGYILTGKTLGIVGLGNIGSKTARLGVGWGMDVVGCVEHATPQRTADFAAKGIRLMRLPEVLEVADYLAIHVPLKDSTRNLIDTGALSLMKPNAYLINLARGGIVDEQGLLQALREDRLAGAGLDVHEHEGEGRISPLADLENVILTPHVGSATYESQREIGRIVLDHMRAVAIEVEHVIEGDS